jgi:hypothetical protein
MRKLIVHTLASLDGVVDNPPSWGSRDYKEDESFRDDLGEVLACDAMLFGRGGYESLQAIFATRSDPWAARINAMNKFVFSATLREAPWKNTRRIEDASEKMKLVSSKTYSKGVVLVTYLTHASASA